MTGPMEAGAGVAGPLTGRYVVLLHTGWGEDHFDLMLEWPGLEGLVTFRSGSWPVTGRTWLERLPQHREAYLSYEGPVSGGRGRVRRVESGVYRASGPAVEGLAGTLALMVLDGDPEGKGTRGERRLRLLREGQGWAVEPG